MSDYRSPKDLKNLRVRKPKTEIETDEVFWDGVAQKKAESLDIPYHKMEDPIPVRNFWFLFLFFFAAAAVLFSRSAYLQTVKGGEFLAQSEDNRFLAQTLKAQRGVIYDRNLKQLAFNESNFNLVCRAAVFEKDNSDKEKTLRKLAEILKKSKAEIEEEIKKQSQGGQEEFILAKNLDINQVIILKAQDKDLAGFEISESDKRNYPDSQVFAPIIGYISSDEEGGSGLEKYYNEYLKEKSGLAQAEMTAVGKVLDVQSVKEPETGNTLVLNVDAGLQKKIFEILSATLEKYGAKKAAAVAVDPQTGAVLAMVSIPSFDSNIFSKTLTGEEYQKIVSDPNFSLYNRAISGKYPIGSTVKPLLAAAALEENIIGADQTIDCHGGIELKDGTFKSDWKTHGATDMRKAIAESCDVYFYTIGGGYGNQKGLGIDRIDKYFDLFGFGTTTGVDLVGEVPGFVPTADWKQETKKQYWYPGDTYNISIGQGDLAVTPLQLTMATAAVANGGILYKPHVVQKIIDEKGNIVKEMSPEVVREGFVSSQNLEVVREGMRQTVNQYGGTATSLGFLPVSAAAKTGTVETSADEYYHNLITVFAPYDKPTIALTIIVESVHKSLGITNAPAKEILDWYFTPEELRPENATSTQAVQTENSTSTGSAAGTVPEQQPLAAPEQIEGEGR
ncbi:MAG: penicillin-binding protein 2 [Candidatus Paceibacterota bacterium]|jgi:penicillin-binding protein 2